MTVRYITRLDTCPANHLRTAVPLIDGTHLYAPSYIPWEPLCISGLAGLEVTDAVEDGVRTVTTKLTATLAERCALPKGPVGFRATAADGTQFVIGLSERPHPVITIGDSHPARASSTCACTLTATWESPFAPLIIVCR